MVRIGRQLVGLAAICAFAALTTASASGAQRLVSQSGAWRAIEADQGKQRLCFVISAPTSRVPAGLRRDPASLFVTLKPAARGVTTELSIQFGFPLGPNGHSASIDDRGFALVSRGETAWLQSETEEGAAVQAMRAGRVFRVSARSTRGNVTTDVYDLTGFTAALDELQKRCRR